MIRIDGIPVVAARIATRREPMTSTTRERAVQSSAERTELSFAPPPRFRK
jgi:hypothetical protein